MVLATIRCSTCQVTDARRLRCRPRSRTGLVTALRRFAGWRGSYQECQLSFYSAEAFYFNAPPPLTLYIHIPWCVRKCPYCDFNSHAARETIPETSYLNALLSDLDHELPRLRGRQVEAVFIGGGTPSLFSPEAIDQLLTSVRTQL